jgi:hypothetical protein
MLCYANNKIIERERDRLDCIEVQYAILCRMLERCLKCCRTVLLVFKSFICPSYDSVCLFYCGGPLPEAELIIV